MKQPIPVEERCQGRVWAWEGDWGSRQCSRRGILVESGKRFCSLHAPSLLNARMEAKQAKWEQKRNTRVAADAIAAAQAAEMRRRAELFPELMGVLEQVWGYLETVPDYPATARLYRTVKEVILKARGG